MKLCRRAFTPAVAKASKEIGDEYFEGTSFIEDLYLTSIDFGAHPNVRGVLGSLCRHEDVPDDPFVRLSFGGIWGADAWETQRALVGALDFAMAISVILAVAVGPPSPRVQEGLQSLNDMRAAAVREVTG